jgi:hypothetical protein
MGEIISPRVISKYSICLMILFFILSFQKSEYAQGEAAIPLLVIQPSPSLSAMGQTGAALPTDDPFGFVWNPAQLGFTSQRNNLSFIFYPSNNYFITIYNAGYRLKGSALNAGYNFKNLTGVPLSLGFGYANVEFDYGFSPFVAIDEYNAYSLGLNVDYYVQLSAGFTIKDVNSSLTFPYPGSQTNISASTTVNDFGILLNVPVLKLIDENLKLGSKSDYIIKPDFNFSLGYSKSNIGDKIYYVDPAQADPLPRMDRLGYGISMGAELINNEFRINSVNLAFTVEADDILITRDTIGTWAYQSTLSDLRFWKNIANIKGDDKIVSHAGFRIEFFETVAFNTGHYSGRSSENSTDGYEIRAKGMFKLWQWWVDSPITDFLSDHVDIVYYNSDFFVGNLQREKIEGLALKLHNLSSFF